MRIIEGNPITLLPDEGMRLTTGDVIAEYAVYLGEGCNPESWYEITEEEYQEMQNLINEEIIE